LNKAGLVIASITVRNYGDKGGVVMKRLYVVLISLLANADVLAEELEFYDFSDVTNITLNGRALDLNPNNDGVLSLTDDLMQTSSAFFTQALTLDNLASFSAAFQFQITDPQGIYDNDGQGADGLTFIVQANPNSVGRFGGGIGYQGLTNSVAVELDTWRNPAFDGNSGNHVAINKDGIMQPVVLADIDNRMNNGELWSVWVDYDGLNEIMEVRVAETNVRPTQAKLSANIDLQETLGTSIAYVGFTSGTGAAGGDHDIVNLQFYDDYNPITVITVDEPDTRILFALSIGVFVIFGRLSNRMA